MIPPTPFWKSISIQKILSGLAFCIILIVLFVPTTSFLPALLPLEVWYKYALAGAILLAVVSGRLFRRETWLELADKKWLLGLLVFIGWIGILWIFQPEDAVGTGDFKYWLIAGGLIFFLWIASPSAWKWIPICFLIVGLINSAAGFGIWVARHFDPVYTHAISATSNVVGTGEGWWYLVGGGLHPIAGLRGDLEINGMADILFWPFMILCGYALSGKRKVWVAAGLIVILLGLFITYSRPTAIVMVVGVAVLFLFRKWKGDKFPWRPILAVLALGTAAAVVLLLLLPRSFVGTVFFRFGMWQQTSAFIQKFPATLLSGGGFPRIVEYPFEVWDTHTMFLYLPVQFGIPGLIFFLVLMGGLLRDGWKIISKNRQTLISPFAAAALSALVCFLIRGLVESQVNELDLLVAFVFFLTYAAETLRREIPKPQTPPKAPAFPSG